MAVQVLVLTRIWCWTYWINSLTLLIIHLVVCFMTQCRKTALAILSHKNGMEALKRGENPTPLQLLVKEMPGETLRNL